MGRFTGVDPIWVKIDRIVDPQRLNLYAYGRNNPLLFLDPDGRDVTIGRCSIGSAQDCFNQLQAGLTKQDREHVKLVTRGRQERLCQGLVLRRGGCRLQERFQEFSGAPDARK